MAVTKDAGFPVTFRDPTANMTDVAWPTFTTPSTDRMIVAMMLLNGGITNPVTSFTSPNLTWANAVSLADGAGNWRVEIWTAFAASVVTAEQIDTAYSGTPNYNRQSLLIWSLAGSDASGVGNTGTRTSTTDPTVAVVASAADSLILAGLPYRSAGGDIGVDANTTSEYDGGAGGGFGFNERAGSRASTGAGSLTLGFTTAELFTMGVMAGIEIKAGGPPPPPPATPMFLNPSWSGMRLA